MRSKTNILIITLLLLLSSIAFLPAQAASTTIGTCDFASLQAAVTAANAGGGAIDFSCSGTITFTSTLTISDGVQITGAGQAIVFDGGNAHQLFNVNAGATLNLIELTLQNGSSGFGGAINNNGSLFVSNVVFDNNDATSSGGAIYNTGSINLSVVTFSNNSAVISGGAIENYGSIGILAGTFSNNVAGSSGAILHGGTNILIQVGTFTNNQATSGGGGAIYVVGSSTLNITSGTFTGNSASNAGGAIYNMGSTTITGSTFTNNTASGVDGGGAIYSRGASPVLNIFTSTFTTNTATVGYGGGLHSFHPTTVRNVTFSGNSATSGGGIHNNGAANMTLDTVVFMNNIATLPGAGSAIWNALDASSIDGTFINNECRGNAIVDLGGNNSDAASIGCPDTPNAPEPVAPEVVASAVTVLGCALDSTDGVELANAPDNTYCRLLMKDGGVISYSGAIPAELISLGVILAVDVYRLEGGASVNTFPNYAQICLAGEGRLFYMDGRNAPRVSIELASESAGGLTCGWIPAPGTVILTN